MQPTDPKAAVRNKVWERLRSVALPDSRFHYDFSSFICDFHGSEDATIRLLNHLQRAISIDSLVFIAPDNCLEHLRYQALRRGTNVLTTSYGIRRGFWLLDAEKIDVQDYRYASMLDGMEKHATHVSLAEIAAMTAKSNLQKIQALVTGTGAINYRGVRFGKGHGYFDLEWGMLSSVGAIADKAPVVAVVHDCQLLNEELNPEPFDTVCDLIMTPSRTTEIYDAVKPTCGILWDRLQPGMLEDIPPLRELKEMQR